MGLGDESAEKDLKEPFLRCGVEGRFREEITSRLYSLTDILRLFVGVFHYSIILTQRMSLKPSAYPQKNNKNTS